MLIKGIETFYPKTKLQWRKWLQKNHLLKDAVWVIMYKKQSGNPTISWSDAVDEALCFGWIDSLKKKLDDESTVQFFSKRKAKSTWSKVNKQKVEKLINEGLMSEAGFESIAIAKRNGSWNILDDVDNLVIPQDLADAFMSVPGSKDQYLALSNSAKKLILRSLIMTKRSGTRQKLIAGILTQLAFKT